MDHATTDLRCVVQLGAHRDLRGGVSVSPSALVVRGRGSLRHEVSLAFGPEDVVAMDTVGDHLRLRHRSRDGPAVVLIALPGRAADALAARIARAGFTPRGRPDGEARSLLPARVLLAWQELAVVAAVAALLGAWVAIG